MKPFYLTYLIRQWRYDRAARIERKAHDLDVIKRGQRRIAAARAAGWLVHADAYTLGASTEADIHRQGLITAADGSPLRSVPNRQSNFVPQSEGNIDYLQNPGAMPMPASPLERTAVQD